MLLILKIAYFSIFFKSVIVFLERDFIYIIRKERYYIFDVPMDIIVDRIEENIVVVEPSKGKVMTYRIDALPKVKEGDVLEINDNGEVFINKKKTKERRKKIKKLMDKVYVN